MDFDLYGEDVVIANKMESGGASDRINVSQTSKELLENSRGMDFEFAFNTNIECKAYDRSVPCYFCLNFLRNEKARL